MSSMWSFNGEITVNYSEFEEWMANAIDILNMSEENNSLLAYFKSILHAEICNQIKKTNPEMIVQVLCEFRKQ